jgi:uncharacterized protein (TIGR02145 family)
MRKVLNIILILMVLGLSCEKDDNTEGKDHGTFTDARDGLKYKWIRIGDQVWMAENLKAREYSDGELLADGKYIENLLGDTITKCWFSYENDENNLNTYGALYTWAAAVNGTSGSETNPSGIQGVCPEGWHLPSDSEWQELERNLGMTEEQVNLEKWRGMDEGGKLKETGTKHWDWPNAGATNECGFTALPGGMIGDMGAIPFDLGRLAHFWTATKGDSIFAWGRSLIYEAPLISRWATRPSHAYSVRCVKDDE